MNEKIHRREFTVRTALAALGGAAIKISGCGESEGPMSPASPSPQPPVSGDVSGVVSANHGHVAVVTAAQLTAANAVVLDIRGSADHPPRVELSEAELNSIASGGRLQKVSTSDFGTIRRGSNANLV